MTDCPINRPPIQCCPPLSAQALTPSLGAVIDISAAGSNVLSTFPCLTSQPDGISTLRIGFFVNLSSANTSVKGARDGGLYENPSKEKGVSKSL